MGLFEPQHLRDVGWEGDVFEVGGWGGGVLNRGAWLRVDGRRVDVRRPRRPRTGRLPGNVAKVPLASRAAGVTLV